MSLLEAVKVKKVFGNNIAANDIDLQVEEGEIVGLIGPNGAGKTTFFNCICGALVPDGGKVIFDGKDITGLPAHLICKSGIARTFQIVRPFGNMSVLDNVMIGAYNATSDYEHAKKLADKEIEFVGLADKREVTVKNLNIGDQRKLEMARALASQPKLLLLDEVMAGLTPSESETVKELIKKTRNSGVTIIMIEHIMSALMELSDKVLVIDRGQKICYDIPEEVVKNKEVIKCYLGNSYEVEGEGKDA